VSIADYAKGADGGKGAQTGSPSKAEMAVRIHVSPMSVDAAAAQLLKAVHAKDAAAIADALRLAYSACQEEYEHDAAPEGEGET